MGPRREKPAGAFMFVAVQRWRRLSEMSTFLSAAAPTLTFLAGFSAKWLMELEQHRRVTAREREARRAVRRDFLEQRRADFQRQTLIELQETCAVLLRKTGQAHHSDEMAFKQNGEWQKALLPENVSELFGDAQRRAQVLLVRVRDPEVRKLAEDLKSYCSAVVQSPARATSRRAADQMIITYDELNRLIGAALRELEDTEAAVS